MAKNKSKKSKRLKVLLIILAVFICLFGGVLVTAKIWFYHYYNELLADSLNTENNKSNINSTDNNQSSNMNQESSDTGNAVPTKGATDGKNGNVNETGTNNSVSPSKTTGANGASDGSVKSSDSGSKNKASQDKGSSNNSDKQGSKGTSLTAAIPSVPLPVNAGKVEDKAESIVGGDIAVSDYVLAGTILLGKLDASEIKYLFSSASDGMYTQAPIEEIKSIQKMVFSKLTDNDLKVLIQVGRKYGKKMYILDKSIDVEKFRSGYYDGKLD